MLYVYMYVCRYVYVYMGIYIYVCVYVYVGVSMHVYVCVLLTITKYHFYACND